jgi:hypothetical protein
VGILTVRGKDIDYLSFGAIDHQAAIRGDLDIKLFTSNTIYKVSFLPFNSRQRLTAKVSLIPSIAPSDLLSLSHTSYDSSRKDPSDSFYSVITLEISNLRLVKCVLESVIGRRKDCQVGRG